MRDIIRLMNAGAKLANAVAKDIERSEKAKIKAEHNSFKKREKIKKSLSKLRKMLAQHRGYIFDKDSKRDNSLREDGLLKDYAFWQFFALTYDKTNSNGEIDENKEKENFEDAGWKAEWREGLKC
jgi:hypothetical protein